MLFCYFFGSGYDLCDSRNLREIAVDGTCLAFVFLYVVINSNSSKDVELQVILHIGRCGVI